MGLWPFCVPPTAFHFSFVLLIIINYYYYYHIPNAVNQL